MSRFHLLATLGATFGLVLACTGTDEPEILEAPELPNRSVFPADNPWNLDISGEPVDPNSDKLIAACGANRELHPDFGTTYDGVPWGIPFVTVAGSQPRVPVVRMVGLVAAYCCGINVPCDAQTCQRPSRLIQTSV